MRGVRVLAFVESIVGCFEGCAIVGEHLVSDGDELVDGRIFVEDGALLVREARADGEVLAVVEETYESSQESGVFVFAFGDTDDADFSVEKILTLEELSPTVFLVRAEFEVSIRGVGDAIHHSFVAGSTIFVEELFGGRVVDELGVNQFDWRMANQRSDNSLKNSRALGEGLERVGAVEAVVDVIFDGTGEWCNFGGVD